VIRPILLLIVNDGLYRITQPFVHLDTNSTNLTGRWDRTRAALDAYDTAIGQNARFPFTYFYRATCRKEAAANCRTEGSVGAGQNRRRRLHARAACERGDWHHDIQIAQRILLITTALPDHNANHDALLKRINDGNLSTGN
jgi:hypothetical protein